MKTDSKSSARPRRAKRTSHDESASSVKCVKCSAGSASWRSDSRTSMNGSRSFSRRSRRPRRAQAKQEIERQLKRLRDQQQQILRDTDELRERMEQEENRERMADAKEQMEQGREHVRQASDALEQGQLAQALTEGTRAGRKLNDVREDLRKNAANRFTEEATDMRNQARQLSQDQQKLTEQLEAGKETEKHALRDSGERKQVREGLDQQEKRLDQLLEQMRRNVEDAEESEPLLAKELYDTVRKAGEQKIPDAIKASQQLVDLGIGEEAAKASRHAGQGLDQLREGVERAVQERAGRRDRCVEASAERA